ncbi:DUF72 domain-containing protein [Anabaena cylindrica FACHB-243]|uniref:DUF72 domain-containing protein n=1 Tax=Anabaena cylindrica (strain ATCC 27899 / PCC 7122) TaxID=272123 RepID=K9ZCD0_ANACC|nr:MULTISPECIES: DUF72 domain-containing protein [Anabaena]AFZ56242.1 protein of unknown function DUF72 [Anabaena cylindrica PCC 7122]MBD2417469.1 DUF72 domain-containing protein [Anabaena cylindrica FACHB-243]MBY5285628.1 DUF72 domain-containing protein [Anabaena sp. CCAP 1446/1C]MBY5310962.1 DUF72 domain-containing protein [Anabaena sp. CCAP 1446/1C]MCM2407638.1 DUF72 domain-containing protein [Anabaena sp. CCAP 1446/1C]
MNFFLGCAVWAYKGWVGELYPPGTRTTEFLRLYSRRFTTVEGNTTFYAVPNSETVTRWATETPPGFEFCLKLPREITHQGLLRSHIPEALTFLEQMRPLGKHLGPIFAQLPPSYSPALLDDLTAFLTAWPRTDIPLALEVRHRDWFQEPHASNLNALLEQLGVGRVLLDTRPIYTGDDDPQLTSERRKPQLPVHFSVTAPFTLVRFISHPQLLVNQPFMAEWVTQIQTWLRSGVRIYFFVHCPTEDISPQNAQYFQQLLEQSGVAVPPLPWNNLNQPPNQLSLW